MFLVLPKRCCFHLGLLEILDFGIESFFRMLRIGSKLCHGQLEVSLGKVYH
jgi:hypothetical protein